MLAVPRTHPVCDCRYNQGIWHEKGSFGFLYEGYRESRNRDLKQNHCVNMLLKASHNGTSYLHVKGKVKYSFEEIKPSSWVSKIHEAKGVLKKNMGASPSSFRGCLQSQGVNLDHHFHRRDWWGTERMIYIHFKDKPTSLKRRCGHPLQADPHIPSPLALGTCGWGNRSRAPV